MTLPRRLNPLGDERLKTNLNRMAAGSNQGATRNARPVGGITNGPRTSAVPVSGFDRIITNWVINSPNITTLPGSHYSIPAWTSVFEESGSAVGLNPAHDDGGIYLFAPGIYACSLILNVGNIGAVSDDRAVRFWGQIFDVPADGAEQFDCTFYPGDFGTTGRAPSTCQVFYSDGGGVSAGGVQFGITYKNLDNAMGDIWVRADVQLIARA